MSDYTFDQVYLAIKMSADSRMNSASKEKFVELTMIMTELACSYQEHQRDVGFELGYDSKLTIILLALVSVDDVELIPPEAITQHFGQEVTVALASLITARNQMGNLTALFGCVRPEASHALGLCFAQMLQNSEFPITVKSLDKMEIAVQSIPHLLWGVKERVLDLISNHHRILQTKTTTSC